MLVIGAILYRLSVFHCSNVNIDPCQVELVLLYTVSRPFPATLKCLLLTTVLLIRCELSYPVGTVFVEIVDCTARVAD